MLFPDREMKLPLDLMYGSPRDAEDSEQSLSEYVNDLQDRLSKVHDYARNKFMLTSNRMKTRSDQKEVNDV